SAQCPSSLRLRIIGNSKLSARDSLFTVGTRAFHTSLERDQMMLYVEDISTFDSINRLNHYWTFGNSTAVQIDSIYVIPKRETKASYSVEFGSKYTLTLSKTVKPALGIVDMPFVQIHSIQGSYVLKIYDEGLSEVSWSNGTQGMELK